MTEGMPMECIHIPVMMFLDVRYRGLSSFSKLLYCVMIDRRRQTRGRGWIDEKGESYIVYPKSELRNFLNVSRSKLDRGYYELEKCVGLIRVEYPEPGQAGRIYLKEI